MPVPDSSSAPLIRSLCLLVPMLLLVALCLRHRPRGVVAGAALLASLWNLTALLVVHGLAVRLGWWRYAVEGPHLLGLPAELYLGWVIMWGALPVIAVPHWPVRAQAALLFGVDVVTMPFLDPVVVLESGWLLGEAVAAAVALVPGLILARWTLRNECLPGRVSLLVVGYGGLVLVVIPSIILGQTDEGWRVALARPAPVTALVFQLLVAASVPALSAVQELCLRGGGTPLPFDPPRRLVTSGPYAYVANPMQAGTALLLLGWAGWTGSLWIAVAAMAAVATSAGIAGWQERTWLESRFGSAWIEWRNEVRSWWPRWRPRVAVPCRLYFDDGCIPCADLARWLQARQPVGLEFHPARSHPGAALTRLTWEGPAARAIGVAAFGRALEHVHLGWAWIGWTLRLPPITPIVQLIADLTSRRPRRPRQ